MKNTKSVLLLDGRLFHIRLEIIGPLHPRQRRTIAVSLFQHLKRSWARHITCMQLHHWDSTINCFEELERRGLKTFKSKGLYKKTGRMGFEFRMKRLELGLTLKQLSEKTGIHIGHLSELERGLYHPHLKTYKILRKYLYEHQISEIPKSV